MTFRFKKGCHAATPYLFWPSRSCKYNIRFDKSCVYPPMELEHCRGDMNKLFYFGSLLPHKNGATFTWQVLGDRYDRYLQLGWRVWVNGESPEQTGHKGTIGIIKPDMVYSLEIVCGDYVRFLFNDNEVATCPVKIKGRWLHSPWFGGGPMSDKCTAPQDMKIDVRFMK